ncbi:MAG: cellulase family glycosylhydrolase [Halanaerobium sp.]|nr:cellulase family glycosylhydrolase [Halanaerobium sp.]
MGKRVIKWEWVGIVVLAAIIFITGMVLMIIKSDNGKILLPVKRNDIFSAEFAEYPGMLTAKDNTLVTKQGSPVILKGLMPQDPAVLHNRNKFSREFFAEISRTGANVVRVPIHPENWVRDKDYLWRYLEPLVQWCGEMRMYVIIDLHFIGNIVTGGGQQMPDIEVPAAKMARDFWSQVAGHFRSVPNVIYEICNEPADIKGLTWSMKATELVSVIREQGARQLIIVGGVEYGKDLSWVDKYPVQGENIAYASHIYPAHSKQLWPEYFGKVASTYPLLITEWGYLEEQRDQQSNYLVGNREEYARPLLDYLEHLGAGWVACWYDDRWLPPMFAEGYIEPNDYGSFVLAELKED